MRSWGLLLRELSSNIQKVELLSSFPIHRETTSVPVWNSPELIAIFLTIRYCAVLVVFIGNVSNATVYKTA